MSSDWDETIKIIIFGREVCKFVRFLRRRKKWRCHLEIYHFRFYSSSTNTTRLYIFSYKQELFMKKFFSLNTRVTYRRLYWFQFFVSKPSIFMFDLWQRTDLTFWEIFTVLLFICVVSGSFNNCWLSHKYSSSYVKLVDCIVWHTTNRIYQNLQLFYS